MDEKKGGRIIKKFLPFLAYAFVILVVFGKALFPADGEIIFGPDIWRYHYFQRPFLGQGLREGVVPWWNPYILSGQPYLEHPQITTWYPPNLLFVFIPTNIAVSWYYAFHIFWAMAGMYVFLIVLSSRPLSRDPVKKTLDSSFRWNDIHVVAWAAGIAFALSGYFVGRIYAGHIDIIAASSWMPFVIMSNVKCQMSNEKTRKKWTVVAAILFAMMLLAGHQMVAVYTVEAIGIAALVYSIIQRSLRPIIVSTFSIVLGLGLAAIQIFPNQQLIAQSIRSISLPEAWSVIAAPTVAHVLEFLDPSFFYSRLPDVGLGHEHAGYIGKVPLFFAITTALFFLFKRKKHIEVLIFTVMSLFSLWVWLGPNAPVDLFAIMRKTLPLYDQIRIPSRHIVLFVLAASALFGMGMQRIRSVLLRVLLCGLVLVDLVPFARANIHIGQISGTREDKDLVAFLTKDQGLNRFLPNFYHGEMLRDVLEFNAPIAYRIFSVSGYETPPLRNYWEFLLAVNNLDIANELSYIETTPRFANITSPYLSFLNVKYILTPIDADALAPNPQRFLLVKEQKERGWRLYENKEVLPRFYLVQNAVVDTRKNIDAAIRGGSGNPQTMVYLEQAPVTAMRPCPHSRGSVTVETYQSDRIVLQTSNPCDSYLVSSEVMYPGWTATIDGKEAPVLIGNLAFRTMRLLAGDHVVQFRYRPRIVYWGAAISLVSLIFAIGLITLNPARKVV